MKGVDLGCYGNRLAPKERPRYGQPVGLRFRLAIGVNRDLGPKYGAERLSVDFNHEDCDTRISGLVLLQGAIAPKIHRRVKVVIAIAGQ